MGSERETIDSLSCAEIAPGGDHYTILPDRRRLDTRDFPNVNATTVDRNPAVEQRA